MRSRAAIPMLLALLIVSPAHPQEAAPAARFPAGLLQGGSLEVFQGLTSLIFTYRATDCRGGAPGIDLGVGTLPATLRNGALLLTPEAGLAIGVPAGPLLLLLRAGASGYAWVGREGNGLVPGVQAGTALLVRLDRRSALRFDLSRRRYFDGNDGTGSLWTVGVGFAVLPRTRYDPSRRIADDRAPPSQP